MKKQLLLFILIIITVIGYSQSNYHDGYIINNDGDTIYGMIKSQGDFQNSEYCIYRLNENSAPIKYMPNEIKAYKYLPGKYYESRYLEHDNIKGYVFLEYLINAIVDVYYYTSLGDDIYFIDEGNGRLVELKNEKKEITTDRPTVAGIGNNYNTKANYITESKEYIGVLKYMFRSSPEIADRVQYTELNHKSLIKISNQYHNKVCPDEKCIVYEREGVEREIRIGYIMGMNRTSVIRTTTQKDASTYIFLNKFSGVYDYYLSYGTFLSVNLPKLGRNVYFQYELVKSDWRLYGPGILATNSVNRTVIYTNFISSSSYGNAFWINFPISNRIPVKMECGINFDVANSIAYESTHVLSDPAAVIQFDPSYVNFQTSSINTGVGLGLGIELPFEHVYSAINLRYRSNLNFMEGALTSNISLNLLIGLRKKIIP